MLILITSKHFIWVIFKLTLDLFEALFLVHNVKISYFSKTRQINQASFGNTSNVPHLTSFRKKASNVSIVLVKIIEPGSDITPETIRQIIMKYDKNKDMKLNKAGTLFLRNCMPFTAFLLIRSESNACIVV